MAVLSPSAYREAYSSYTHNYDTPRKGYTFASARMLVALNTQEAIWFAGKSNQQSGGRIHSR